MKLNEHYIYLFEKKYQDSITLLLSSIEDEYHLLWYMCKDFAKKILMRDPNWQWLAIRLDDFSLLVTQYISSRMRIWIWRAGFELGALYKHLYSIKNTVRWLMSRWVSTLKNLFDIRYSYHVPPSFLMSFDEDYILGKI